MADVSLRMDREAFQADSQTTLIAVCFVSPPSPTLPLAVLRQTSEEYFQEQKGTRIASAYLALGHTGNWVLFPSFHPSNIWSLLPSTARKTLSLHQLLFSLNPVHGVFPCMRWVLGADRISSTPKCFLFLPLFIFFPFLIGCWLSIRPPTHALCHVL